MKDQPVNPAAEAAPESVAPAPDSLEPSVGSVTAAAEPAKAEASAPESAPVAEPAEPEASAPELVPVAEVAEPEASALELVPVAEVAEPEASVPAPTKPAVQRGRPRLKLEQLVVGAEFKGKVMRTSQFGAFVDIGAITDGLVHITELSDRRVKSVDDVVKSGDPVAVWIKEVDQKKNRISLSMRKRVLRPLQSLKVGDVVDGHVTNVTKYGAFVDIGSDTEGLVHISEMASGFTQSASELVEVGRAVQVRIKEIDARQKRISLTMKGLVDDDAAVYAAASAEEAPMPTVMEMALRKAMGQMDDDDEAYEPAAPNTVAPTSPESLGEVYARMLEEYRAQRDPG